VAAVLTVSPDYQLNIINFFALSRYEFRAAEDYIMFKDLILTDDQLSDFHNNGFLIVRGIFDADQMSIISGWSDEMLARPEKSGTHWVYHEKSSRGDGIDLVSRIENISPFHKGFQHLIQALEPAVSQLLGEKAILFKEKINFKMPGGDGFKPHQDLQAGWDVYADFFVSALVSIDAATVENGCLELCGGHHRNGLFRSWEPLTELDMNGMVFTPYPTEPGDVVFFDCYAPHQSAPNMSNTIRRIYYATFNRESDGKLMERYYSDKHKSYPPDIDRNPNMTYTYRV